MVPDLSVHSVEVRQVPLRLLLPLKHCSQSQYVGEKTNLAGETYTSWVEVQGPLRKVTTLNRENT